MMTKLWVKIKTGTWSWQIQVLKRLSLICIKIKKPQTLNTLIPLIFCHLHHKQTLWLPHSSLWFCCLCQNLPAPRWRRCHCEHLLQGKRKHKITPNSHRKPTDLWSQGHTETMAKHLKHPSSIHFIFTQLLSVFTWKEMFQHSHLFHTKVFCNLKYFNGLQEVSNLLQQEEVWRFCWLGGCRGGLHLDLYLKMLLSSTLI